MASSPTNISVDIVASFGAFKEQLDQAAAATKSFADNVKSSLGSIGAPIEKLQNLLLGIGAIVAGGAIFKDIVKTTLDVTNEVVKLKLAFGGSLEQADGLANSLRLLNVSTDDYIGYAIRLDRQVRLNNDSLQRMGFTARDLDLGQKGLVDKAIGKLLEYKEGVDRNIAAQVLFGRNVQDIYPLLRMHLEETSVRANKLAEQLHLTVTEDDKARWADYRIAVNEMGMAFEGIKKSIGEAVLPYLTRFAQWFTASAPAIIASMGDITRRVIDGAINMAEAVAIFAVNVAESFKSVIAWIKTLSEYWNAISWLSPIKWATAIGGAAGGAAGSLLGNTNLELDRTGASIDSVVAKFKQLREFLSGSPIGGALPGLPTGTKSAAGLVGDTNAVAAMMDYWKTAIKLQDEYYATLKERVTTDLALGRITETEKTNLLVAAINTRERTQLMDLDAELADGRLSVAQRQKVEDEKSIIVAKAAKDRQAVLDAELLYNMRGWESSLGELAGAFNSQLRGLLAGTTSWAQAMKNITADLVLKMIEEFEKLAIIKPLVTALASFTAPAEFFAQILKMIMASVGQVFSGVSAFLAPILGPAAPAAAAGVAAGVEGAAVGLAQLDVGAWNIPRAGMAMLHPGETVLPASAAEAFRAMASGGGGVAGGGEVHLHVHAIDAASVRDFFFSSKRQLADVLKTLVRDNPSLKPA